MWLVLFCVDQASVVWVRHATRLRCTEAWYVTH
jgi:hypothetical protein